MHKNLEIGNFSTIYHFGGISGVLLQVTQTHTSNKLRSVIDDTSNKLPSVFDVGTDDTHRLT